MEQIREGDTINVNMHSATKALVGQVNGELVFLTLLDGPYVGEHFIRTVGEIARRR